MVIGGRIGCAATTQLHLFYKRKSTDASRELSLRFAVYTGESRATGDQMLSLIVVTTMPECLAIAKK